MKLTTALIVLAVGAGGCCLTRRAAGGGEMPPAGAQGAAAEQKLDAPLRELVRQKSGDAASLAAWRAKHQLTADRDRIGVDITCTDAKQSDAVAAAVQKLGGDVVSRFENTVFASVPAAAVKPLSEMADVWSMKASRATLKPIRRQGAL